MTKKDLMDIARMFKNEFNSKGFTSKRDTPRQIKSVEVVGNGTAVYCWCRGMNNLVIYGGSKKGTYNEIQALITRLQMGYTLKDLLEFKEAFEQNGGDSK